MIQMFRKFLAFDGSIPTQFQYVSTHPMTADRIRVLQTIHSAAHYVPVATLSEEEWASVKNACKAESESQ